MKTIKYSIIFSIFFVAFLSAQEKYVGIGTDNPKNNLDIRGNVMLTPDNVTDNDDYSPLMRLKNGQEGEHKIVSGSSVGSDIKDKSYYKVDLIVNLKNSGSPECLFNTHIPVSDYNLVIINSVLEDNDGNAAAVSHLQPALSHGSTEVNQNSPKQVDLLQKDGSWEISANYPYTYAITQDDSGKIRWHFSLLVIKKNISEIIDPNPNYEPKKYKEAKEHNKPEPDKEHRYYSDYDPNNPNNAADNETQSLRGDAFKLNKAMRGGAKVNPLKNY